MSDDQSQREPPVPPTTAFAALSIDNPSDPGPMSDQPIGACETGCQVASAGRTDPTEQSTVGEEVKMQTCFSFKDVQASLTARKPSKFDKQICQKPAGKYTELAMISIEGMDKVHPLALRELPISKDDPVWKYLPHTTTVEAYVRHDYTVTDEHGQRTCSDLYSVGVRQDRPGVCSESDYVGPSFEHVAGKIDPKDVELYPAESEYPDPRTRAQLIIISSSLRELHEEVGLDMNTYDSIEILSISPIMHKDAGLTNATNVQVRVLMTVKNRPIETLPASRNLSKNEIQQRLVRNVIPWKELSTIINGAGELGASVDVQLEETSYRISFGERCRYNLADTLETKIEENLTSLGKTSYTAKEVMEIARRVKKETLNDPDKSHEWITDASRVNVGLPSNYFKY